MPGRAFDGGPLRPVSPPTPLPPVMQPPLVDSPRGVDAPPVSPPAASDPPAPARPAFVATPLRPLPPPPPPRSTPAPLRPDPKAASRFKGIKPAAAMGTASTGIRWKGEVHAIAAGAQGESDAAEQSATRQELVRSIPSWLVSMVIHLTLLVLLALLTGPVGQDMGRVLLTLGQSEGVKDAALTEFTIDQQSSLLEEIDALEVDVPVEVALPTIDSINPDFSDQAFAPVAVDSGLGLPAIPASPMVGGRSGAMKKTLLTLYGGTAVTEEAVGSGLQWLARNQKRDGSWSLRGPYDDGGSTENQAAATAMALLAFMGAGNTHTSGEHREVVEKGVKWLLKQQNRDGFFAKGARDHQQAYAQAQCSIAVCELYAMTHDSWLREPAQRSIDCAEAWQAPEGGWRYQPRFDSDTSVTGWFVMALQSGLSSGLEVDRAVLYRVSDFLNTVQSYEGAAYSYQPRGGPSQSMTAEGLLCRQYLGWARNHPSMIRGVEAMSSDYNFDIADTDYYYWYYATQVLHHYGGEPWNAWNQEMRERLPAAQIKRGQEVGSWPPQSDRWGGTGGRLYTTCMAIYCLEVYYRHMPLYKAEMDDEALPGVESAVD